MAQMPKIGSDHSAPRLVDLQFYHDYFEGLFRSNFFKCLNDETRQKILLLVGQYGEEGVRVGEIAEQFHLDRTTISHHLAMLRDSNLLSVARKGKERYYAVNSDYIISSLEKVVEIYKSCRDNCRQIKGCCSATGQS
jgi:DNA-binding transcriptional ArsR family regulator